MMIPKKIFCRAYQFAFRLAMPILPYREPKALNSVEDIADELVTLHIKNVLLITDEFLYSSGATKDLENSLESAGISAHIYSKTSANPTVHNVEDALCIYNAKVCGAIIAFGGGSPMDCAKAVGARFSYPKKTLKQLGGLLKICRKLPPLFAIPTTAGTGSEVTVTAVITDSETKHKYTMNSFPLIPHYAILDPKVTYSLPPHLTASTGMDALTHAVEAYIGGSTSKQTRRLAKEAVLLIFKNIELAYSDAHNFEARKNMLHASYSAGIAFSKSYVGYIHAIAHSLGGQYNMPHGLTNAILLPIVLEHYGICVYKKLDELAKYAGISPASESTDAGAKRFIQAIRDMNSRMEIPEKISGIALSDIPKMARYADKEANPLYPVPMLMNAKELKKLYFKAADWS